MTPETKQLIEDLSNWKRITEAQEDLPERHKKRLEELQRQHEKKLELHERNTPLKPSKKAIKSLVPRTTTKGIIFPIAFILSIIMIIVSISTFIDIRKINNIMEEPGEAYEEWCEILAFKGDFNDMTEEEWEPVQKEWDENGVSITWNEVKKINAKNEFNIYGGRIVYDIFEGELESLPQTGGFCAFIAIVGIILLIVMRKGLLDMLDTLGDILDIPKIKKQNEASRIFNATEYTELMKVYENKIDAHKKTKITLEESYQNQIKAEKEAQQAEGKKLSKEKLDFINNYHYYVEPYWANDIEYFLKLYVHDCLKHLVSGHATTMEEAVKCEHRARALKREQKEWEKKHEAFMAEHFPKKESSYVSVPSSYSNNDNYEAEMRRHNTEMERMERERLQMEKDIARKEERERQKAKERDEHERKRQEFMDHQKAREEKRRNDAGLRHQCNTCQLASKCYGRGSYPCPTYRPR